MSGRTVVASNAIVVEGANGRPNALAQTITTSAAGGLHLLSIARIEIQSTTDFACARLGALAIASINDRFTLDVPGYAAVTLFTVSAGIRIDAINSMVRSFSAGNGFPLQASASWKNRVLISPSLTGALYQVDQNDFQNCVDDALSARCLGGGGGWRAFSLVMPNQSWAANLHISAEARSNSQAELSLGSANVSGMFNLGHTIAWGGITGLVDPLGASVANFSAVSATSGFDYRNAYGLAVPEMSPARLLLAGLARLAWLTRRRRR